MKKLLISFVLVFTMLFSMGTVAFALYEVTVTNNTELEDALANEDNENSITLNGDVYAGWPTIPSGKTVTIKGDGTLNCEGIDVEGTLLLKGNVDIVSESCVTVWGSFIMSGGSVVVTNDVYAVDIAAGGSFDLSGGTVSGGTKSGVRVPSSGGGGGIPSFDMTGGKVASDGNGVESTGNLAISGGEISGGKTGIKVADFGVGTTKIAGGSISGNASGIEIGSGRTVTMEGGSVTGNGDGVVNNGTFTMSNGSVEAANGDGVANNGTFTMSNGSVGAANGNGVSNNGEFNMDGGSVEASKVGVSNEGNGSFTMTDGFVKGEEANMEDNGANKSQLKGGTLYTPPVPNPYNVPSTADNSNMPLWSALFIVFAVVAILSGKKRKA